jgi:hypothetical protein
MGDKPKHPVRLTNQFIVKLTGTAMWWDDDPKATGFGVRSYPGGSKSFFIDYRLGGRQRRYTARSRAGLLKPPENAPRSCGGVSIGATIRRAISASVA